MRQVTITRRKSFSGMLIPYSIFTLYLRAEIDPLDPEDIWEVQEGSEIKISNGQTITFPIREEKCSLVVWAITSTGAAGGPAYYIDEGTSDISLELITRYSFWNGSRYILRPALSQRRHRLSACFLPWLLPARHHWRDSADQGQEEEIMA
jgi:hypothetical protein